MFAESAWHRIQAHGGARFRRSAGRNRLPLPNPSDWLRLQGKAAPSSNNQMGASRSAVPIGRTGTARESFILGSTADAHTATCHGPDRVLDHPPGRSHPPGRGTSTSCSGVSPTAAGPVPTRVGPTSLSSAPPAITGGKLLAGFSCGVSGNAGAGPLAPCRKEGNAPGRFSSIHRPEKSEFPSAWRDPHHRTVESQESGRLNVS